MYTAFELAGFFAAHAVWSLSEADGFTPMLAYTDEDGQRSLDRFAIDDTQVAVENAKQRLASNPMDANDATLLYDGRITVDGKKLDAIIIEIRAYFSLGSEAMVAVPYTPSSTGAFRLHRPKLLEWTQCEDFDSTAVFEEFFKGVGQHEHGSKIWNDCLDESN